MCSETAKLTEFRVNLQPDFKATRKQVKIILLLTLSVEGLD
jgi:hypothetical protein